MHVLPKDVSKNMRYNIIQKRQKLEPQLKYSSTGRWMNKGRTIYAVEYIPWHADELWLYRTIAMKLTNKTLNEREGCIPRASFFFFGHAHGMQKFPGQGSNLHHSSSHSHSSDNARALTRCTTRELRGLLLI